MKSKTTVTIKIKGLGKLKLTPAQAEELQTELNDLLGIPEDEQQTSVVCSPNRRFISSGGFNNTSFSTMSLGKQTW